MKNNIITIVLIVVVAVVVFSYLFRTTPSDAILTADVKTSDSTDAKYIYNILNQMKSVTLDDKIFQNPIFLNLKDNTASLPSQITGRNNPFSTYSNTPVQTAPATNR